MRLLVPVDFSDITNPVLNCVKEILQKHGGEAVLLHVISPAIYLPYPEGFGFEIVDVQLLEQIEKERRKVAEEKLTALSEYLKPFSSSSIVKVGDPRESILEVEEEENPDMTLMGSHRKALVERILIGSTAQKVAKHCNRPLLIVKGKEPELSGDILITYDFSKLSEGMLEYLSTFLKPFNPKSITLLHVDEPIGMPLIERVGKELENKYREQKVEYLSSLKDKMEAEGFKVNVEILKGKDVVKEIKEYIEREEERFGLVAVGSKGLSGLKRILLGSNSGRLLTELELPILLYKEGES